jgi:hypothetical protein
MTNQELAKSIRHGLFADRETLKEAFDYAFRVINSLKDGDQIAATTAMYVVLNTLAKEIEKAASDTIFSHIERGYNNG